MTLRLTSPQAAIVSSVDRVQPLHQRLQVALQDAVELHGFTGGQADGAVAAFVRQFLQLQPL